MPMTFSYTALNPKGKSVTGTVPADSRSAAIAQVISKGLSPVRIEEANKANKSSKQMAMEQAATGLVVPKKVSQRIIEDFTRELASLLAGGVPLARALALLKRETKQPGPLALWTRIHDDVVEGNSQIGRAHV